MWVQEANRRVSAKMPQNLAELSKIHGTKDKKKTSEELGADSTRKLEID